MEPGASIKASPIVGNRKRPKTNPTGRVCGFKDCTTLLSVYNKEDRCYLHAPRRRPRIRGRDYSEPQYPKCAKCAARARDSIEEHNEIVLEDLEIGMVVHREGTDGAATLCEGSLSSDLKTAS